MAGHTKITLQYTNELGFYHSSYNHHCGDHHHNHNRRQGPCWILGNLGRRCVCRYFLTHLLSRLPHRRRLPLVPKIRKHDVGRTRLHLCVFLLPILCILLGEGCTTTNHVRWTQTQTARVINPSIGPRVCFRRSLLNKGDPINIKLSNCFSFFVSKARVASSSSPLCFSNSSSYIVV